ncbi:endonuclease domain-containing protein [Nocardioides sp. TF02-7]|uniref:endonuclease domain-containing protein n=1 Tax=Nocardioides sp. TF02-7 TaxID=2917724 RepID=UPI001F056A0E|nr:endonuclease domain-containing protein [Nocardioides sp. TF02-7]UMG91479.1 endonuclease domain-containing protein [Nocardioides sp. TF02-7]
MAWSRGQESWRQVAAVAAQQGGLITRAQLGALGVDRWAVRHRIATGRWVEWTPTVIGTTTGELGRRQLMWLGVLHAGPPALVGDLTAAEVGGLRNWHRDDVTVLVPRGTDLGRPVPGIGFVQTRRPLPDLRRTDLRLPVCRLEPAVLHFAAYQDSRRTAEGVVAAVVQQRLTSPAALLAWLDRMQPLRWARILRAALVDIAGGAQSVAELDVRRMCRRFGLAAPARQTKRRDASGRVRFTDCEWRLRDGRVLVLEVDGGFHMEVEHWKDDIARQRALTSPDRVVVRCTARELRDQPDVVARDLRNLGVPAAA